ncbi:MAG: adenylate/guanylate cyclase domain-containing protein [Candidatus Hodarchaeales archaeon]|jgi:hypothetical protein
MNESYSDYMQNSNKRIRELLKARANKEFFLDGLDLNKLINTNSAVNNFSVCRINFNLFFTDIINMDENNQFGSTYSILMREIISLIDHFNGLFIESSLDGLTVVFNVNQKQNVNPVLSSVKFALNLLLLCDENIIPILKEQKVANIEKLQLKIGIAYGKTYIEKISNSLNGMYLIYGNANILARKLAKIVKPKEVALGGNVVESLSSDKTMYVSITTPDETEWPESSALIKFHHSTRDKIVDFIKKL